MISHPRQSSTGRPPFLSPRIAALATLGILGVLSYIFTFEHLLGMTDLHVYFDAQRDLHRGLNPYLGMYTRFGLKYTYPPFAFIAFSWMDYTPFWVANLVLSASSLVALAAVVILFKRAHGRKLLYTTIIILLIEPVWRSIGLGQVNLVLMGLISIDCLKVRYRYRGILIGVAGAVKLTPLVFVVYLVASRQWWAAARSTVVFAVAEAVAYWLYPRPSHEFWATLLGTRRAGNPDYVANQSINGLVSRVRPGSTILWVAGCTFVAAIIIIILLRGYTYYSAHLRLTICALLGLMISPISWTHHWVWVAPVFLTIQGHELVRSARWSGRILVGLTLLAPMWWLPYSHDKERLWNWWQIILGNSYLLSGMAFVVIVAIQVVTRDHSRHNCPRFAIRRGASHD